MADQPTSMSGTAPNTGTSVNGSYEYDGNLKRVKTVVNGITRYNVYDHKGRLVHVEEGDGNYVSETNYLHGAGMTLARIKDGVFTYMHPDHLGSPQVGTNADAVVEWNEYYTPFGEALLGHVANDNQSGFTGHIKDADTGLNYMQARYFDSNVGRFLSIDPVDFLSIGEPSMFNRYAYAANDPVNYIDPNGEQRRGRNQPSARQQIRTAHYHALTVEFQSLTGTPIAQAQNYRPSGRDIRQLQRSIQQVRREAEAARWQEMSPRQRAEAEAAYDAIYGGRLGAIYEIPGSGTPSNRKYNSRSVNPESRLSSRRDGRDGTQAEFVDVAVPEALLPVREQVRMNQNGGVNRLDNARNEIRPESWPDHKIGPPEAR